LNLDYADKKANWVNQAEVMILVQVLLPLVDKRGESWVNLKAIFNFQEGVATQR
jgi:hypothetical protein